MLPYKIKMSKKLKVMVIVLAVIITLIVIKVVWVACATSGLGDWDSERKDIIRRANYLTERVVQHHYNNYLMRYLVVLASSFRGGHYIPTQ
jgi:hypothetical protein